MLFISYYKSLQYNMTVFSLIFFCSEHENTHIVLNLQLTDKGGGLDVRAE